MDLSQDGLRIELMVDTRVRIRSLPSVMEDGIKNSPVCFHVTVNVKHEYCDSRIRFQDTNPYHTVEHPLSHSHNTRSYTQSRSVACNKHIRVLTNTHSYISHLSNTYSSDCNESIAVFKPGTKENQQIEEGDGGETAEVRNKH
jgi:hypothetical protein